MRTSLSSCRLYACCADADRAPLESILNALREQGPEVSSLAELDLPTSADPGHALARMLAEASALLLFVSFQTPESTSVQRDLDAACRLGTPIVVVRLQPEVRLPERLADAPAVQWKSDEAELIQDLVALLRELPVTKGTPPPPPPLTIDANILESIPSPGPGGFPQAPQSTLRPSFTFPDPNTYGSAPRAAMVSDSADHVEFSALSPTAVQPGSPFTLEIWAYLRDQYDDVRARARETGHDREVGVKSAVPVDRGTVIAVQLEIPSLVVEDNVDTLVWDGDPANVTFLVEVPAAARHGNHAGKAILSREGVPFAKLVFMLQVEDNAQPDSNDSTTALEFPHSAFASYASLDRAEVLRRLQGIKTGNPELDIFLDVLTLRSGDDWERKLRTQVPNKEIFYLFWSQAAHDSEWVGREWRLALKERGIEYIVPVPLADPRVVPPPTELGALHFNDAFIAYIKYEDQMKKLREGSA